MLLKPASRELVFAGPTTATSVARALDAVLPGASIRESRFPISLYEDLLRCFTRVR
jgi:hypothetical protein